MFCELTGGYVEDGGVGRAGGDGVDGVDAIAVPGDVVAWVDGGDVDHTLGQGEVRV